MGFVTKQGAPANAARSTRPGTALCFLPSSNTAMAPSEGIPEKKSSRLSSVQGENFLVKEEPVLSKHANSYEQRTLKVQIKINSDKIANNKAAIYSGLGLNTTPSSSTGNSCQDNSGVPPQCAGAQESPRNILQVITLCFSHWPFLLLVGAIVKITVLVIIYMILLSNR